jgi:hypothetical protein
MTARGVVLKWASSSGALDDLPLDALKLYLLLFIRAEAVNSESRMGLPTIQRVLGRSFSREDCQQALTTLAAHDLLTWAPMFPRPSRRRRALWAREDLEIVFSIRNVCEGRRL